jgi:hypothetical protein
MLLVGWYRPYDFLIASILEGGRLVMIEVWKGIRKAGLEPGIA